MPHGGLVFRVSITSTKTQWLSAVWDGRVPTGQIRCERKVTIASLPKQVDWHGTCGCDEGKCPAYPFTRAE